MRRRHRHTVVFNRRVSCPRFVSRWVVSGAKSAERFGFRGWRTGVGGVIALLTAQSVMWRSIESSPDPI